MMATKRTAAQLHQEDLHWVREKDLLARPDYIERDAADKNIIAVYCKKCGSLIQGLVQGGRPKIIVSGNKTVEQWPVTMAALPPYTEVQILCDDGSMHVSPCCKECAPFLTEDDLDAFLIADTAAELQEGKAFGTPISNRLLEQRVMRRFKREEV